MRLYAVLKRFSKERLFLGILKRSVEADNEIIKKIFDLSNKSYKKITRKEAKKIWLDIFNYPVYAKQKTELKGLKGRDIILRADELSLPKISNETVKRYLRLMNLFYNWLVDEGIVDKNPFRGLKPKKDLTPKNKKRHKFDDKHLEIIFSDHIFHSKIENESFKYWTPLLTLCNGLRQTEAAQLESKDIKLVEDIWCINVNKDSELKHVKNSSSIRTIPISEHLINLGFIDFAKSRQGHLFPELPYGRNGYGTKVSKWMSYKKKSWGLTRGFDYYSFRHTFIHSLKIQGCDESIVAEIVGHAHNGITFGVYGKDYGLNTKKKVIDLFDARHAINLPRLY